MVCNILKYTSTCNVVLVAHSLLLFSPTNFIDLGTDCEEEKQKFIDAIPPGDEFLRSLIEEFPCGNCTLEGFYYDEDGAKKTPQALHSQAHIRLGRDILDVTTSPNVRTGISVWRKY